MNHLFIRIALQASIVVSSSYLFWGCAHLPSQKNSQSSVSATEGAGAPIKLPAALSEVHSEENGPAQTIQVNSKGEIWVRGMKLENNTFDYPITINSRVEFWIDYFTVRGRKNFEKYLERSELFIPFIKPILRQNGLPEDLVYLAMIESGFNNHARSTAKAVGPWQFISATGKRYGLMVNWWVDERRDTQKSTVAAVEYLRDLYNMFQSWELAAASYNAGEAKVARAIRRYGTRDFWSITRHKFLRPETRDYVPKIIAAALIAKNRTQFGFSAPLIQPNAKEVVAGDGEVVKVLQEGEVKEPIDPREETISSVLEEELEEDFEDRPEGWVSVPALAQGGAGEPAIAKAVSMPTVTKKGALQGEDLLEFEVQSPADLLKVARAAGLAYQTVKSLNPELLRWVTPPTVSTYRIKLPASVKEKFLAAYNDKDFPRKVDFLAYKVRKGETLQKVAKHFGIKVDPLGDLNGFSVSKPLGGNSKVLLPMPNDRSRTVASLEVRDPPELRSKRNRRRGKKVIRISLKKREASRPKAWKVKEKI